MLADEFDRPDQALDLFAITLFVAQNKRLEQLVADPRGRRFVNQHLRGPVASFVEPFLEHVTACELIGQGRSICRRADETLGHLEVMIGALEVAHSRVSDRQQQRPLRALAPCIGARRPADEKGNGSILIAL